MLRAGSSKVAGFAFRAIGCGAPRITNAVRNFSAFQFRHHDLVDVLDSEIKTMQLMPLRPSVPDDFPFKIHHHFNLDNILLSRELDGEEINVTIKDVVVENENDPLKLEVQILKKYDGKLGKSMKFSATASAKEIMIQKLTTEEYLDSIVVSKLYFKMRPESAELQTGFRDFLKRRGIEESVAGFLYEYMVWKSKLPSYYSSKYRTVEAYSAGKINQPDAVEVLTKLKQVIKDW